MYMHDRAPLDKNTHLQVLASFEAGHTSKPAQGGACGWPTTPHTLPQTSLKLQLAAASGERTHTTYSTGHCQGATIHQSTSHTSASVTNQLPPWTRLAAMTVKTWSGDQGVVSEVISWCCARRLSCPLSLCPSLPSLSNPPQ